MIRVVIDPSVIVSGAIIRMGPPGVILDAAEAGGIEVAASPRVFEELGVVFACPKFRRYFPREESDAFIEGFARQVRVYPDTPVAEPLTRDPHDDYLVVLAQAAGARAIVTGDKDLLAAELQPPAVTPREFVDSLSREE